MAESRFEVKGGQQSIGGKPDWPDVLRVYMDAHGALEMLQILSRQLQGKNDRIAISWCGKLALIDPGDPEEGDVDGHGAG